MDLIILIDTTESMSVQIVNLRKTIKLITNFINISGIKNVRIIEYKDYDIDTLKKKTKVINDSKALLPHLADTFIQSLTATDGGDEEEAVFTALIHFIKIIEKNYINVSQKPIIIVYADANAHYSKTLEAENEIKYIQDNYPEYINDTTENATAAKTYASAVYTAVTQSNTTCTTAPVVDSQKIINTIINFNIPINCIVNKNPSIFRELSSRTKGEYINESKNLVLSVLEILTKYNTKESIKALIRKTDTESLMSMTKSFESLLNDNKLYYITKCIMLSEFWSFICRSSEENITECSDACALSQVPQNCCLAKHCKIIMNKVSVIVQNTTGAEKAEIQKWLDDSRDNTPIIEAAITACGTYDKVVILSDAHAAYNKVDVYTRATINNMILSLQHTGYITLLDIITNLKIVTPAAALRQCNNSLPATPCNNSLPDTKCINTHALPMATQCAVRFLPINIELLFKHIGHLICKGLILNRYMSFVIALLCIKTNNCLKKLAIEYLTENNGLWIKTSTVDKLDQGFTCTRSYGFILLITSIEFPILQKILTDDEHRMFNRLLNIIKLKMLMHLYVEIKQCFIPKLTELKDYKQKCNVCKQYTSETLLCSVKNVDRRKMKLGKTIIPVYESLDDWENRYKLVCGRCIDGDPIIEDNNENISKLISCGKCGVTYAVKSTINSFPKCYACRKGVTLPKTMCRVCEFEYLNIDAKSFKCKICVIVEQDPNASAAPYHYIKIQVKNLIKMDIPSIKEDISVILNLLPMKIPIPTKYNGIPIVNHNEIMEFVKDKNINITRDDVCMICYESVDRLQLRSCGNKSCIEQMCRKCFEFYRTGFKPGQVIDISRLFCCFCRQIIKVSRNVNVPIIKKIDETKIYKWCIGCNKAIEENKPACAPQEQCNTELRDVNFQCDMCLIKNEDLYKIICKGCGNGIIKSTGCNHITCICGVHMCYLCGKEFDLEVIYDHINDVHYRRD